jgi:hypothetical protein
VARGLFALAALGLSTLAIAAGLMGGVAGAAPDPVKCTGYPEPRVYLENQSWWDPQVGPASHPGTGKQGHIHVGTCFPLYQKITDGVLHLDINVKLHNMPGVPSWLRATSYGDQTWEKRDRFYGETPASWVPPCASADCDYWISWDIPVSQINYNGWHEFTVYLNVTGADGNVQRNWGRWYVYFDLPGKPLGVPGANGTFGTGAALYGDPGGDTWYSSVDTGGKYASARIPRAELPWDETTGALKPLSGTWRPSITFEKQANFAFIDPALHATPPSKGTVVYEATDTNTGLLTRQLAIDTTKLTNGVHRLVFGSGNVAANGTNTGVLVVPFLVDNPGCG